MTTDEQILRDLVRHMRGKVLLNVADFADRCRDAELDYGDCMTELMLFFTRLTASFAANQFKFEPNDFARVLVLEYQAAQKRETEKDN